MIGDRDVDDPPPLVLKDHENKEQPKRDRRPVPCHDRFGRDDMHGHARTASSVHEPRPQEAVDRREAKTRAP